MALPRSYDIVNINTNGSISTCAVIGAIGFCTDLTASAQMLLRGGTVNTCPIMWAMHTAAHSYDAVSFSLPVWFENGFYVSVTNSACAFVAYKAASLM